MYVTVICVNIFNSNEGRIWRDVKREIVLRYWHRCTKHRRMRHFLSYRSHCTRFTYVCSSFFLPPNHTKITMRVFNSIKLGLCHHINCFMVALNKDFYPQYKSKWEISNVSEVKWNRFGWTGTGKKQSIPMKNGHFYHFGNQVLWD